MIYKKLKICLSDLFPNPVQCITFVVIDQYEAMLIILRKFIFIKEKSKQRDLGRKDMNPGPG